MSLKSLYSNGIVWDSLFFTFWARVVEKVTLDIVKDCSIYFYNSILPFTQSIWEFTCFSYDSSSIIKDLPVFVIKSHLSIILSLRFNLAYLIITLFLLIMLSTFWAMIGLFSI